MMTSIDEALITPSFRDCEDDDMSENTSFKALLDEASANKRR
ncbi:MAG: hypothetical protein Q4B17_02700 [Lautropia sp.]|nr:hypothetical protein [Lautropia sp.]